MPLLILPIFFQSGKISPSLRLSIQSCRPSINIEPVSFQQSMVRLALIELAVRQGKIMCQLGFDFRVYDYSHRFDGLLSVAQNSSVSSGMRVFVRFERLVNVSLSFSDLKPQTMDSIYIPPRSSKILFVASRHKPRDRFYIKHCYNLATEKIEAVHRSTDESDELYEIVTI
ncbi:hypothetical protein ACOME3_002888 [Neoechinorhynchus agilis]